MHHSVYMWHQSEGGLPPVPCQTLSPRHQSHVKHCHLVTSPMSNTVTLSPVPCQTLSPCHQSHVKHCHLVTSPMSNTVTPPPVPCQTLSPCHQSHVKHCHLVTRMLHKSNHQQQNQFCWKFQFQPSMCIIHSAHIQPTHHRHTEYLKTQGPIASQPEER